MLVETRSPRWRSRGCRDVSTQFRSGQCGVVSKGWPPWREGRVAVSPDLERLLDFRELQVEQPGSPLVWKNDLLTRWLPFITQHASPSHGPQENIFARDHLTEAGIKTAEFRQRRCRLSIRFTVCSRFDSPCVRSRNLLHDLSVLSIVRRCRMTRFASRAKRRALMRAGVTGWTM